MNLAKLSMGSLAWRTFHGCFVSRQALPFIKDVIALREPQQEERVVEEERGLIVKLQADPRLSRLPVSALPCESFI